MKKSWSDIMATPHFKITPGIGISLLIGVAGSIYIIAQSGKFFSKLSQRRRVAKKPNAVCYMCNVNIDLKDSNTFATCKGCERLVCRNEKCAEWISSIGIWECATCHSNRVIQQKAGEWLLQQLNVRIKSPGPVNLKKDSIFGLNEADDSRSTTSSISSNQRVKVREFIEELLSSMLNGPLDDVSVGQLCKNENYLPLWEGYHDSPGDKHIELKRMVQNIIEEVLKIPDLLNYSGYPDRREEPLPFFDPKKYEQLLATAVLNKVVDSYRNDKNFLDNSSGVHSDSEFDSNHNLTGKKSVKNENIKPMSLTIDELNENLARSKNELNSYNQRESDTDESYLSDYIQKHTVPLPDLSDSTSTAEEDNQSVKSNGTDGTWEENWLFKKRQLKTADTSIAMLVPSPTEEVRALIGDKNADEISDLSEAGSDVEDYESDSLSKNQTESSTKNSTDDMLHPDSLISLNSIPYNEPLLSEAKNNLLLMQGDYEYNKTSGDSGNGVDDLISIESSDAVPLIIEPIICQHKLVVVEENNNIVTDDAKTLNEINLYDTALAENEDNSVYPVAAARCLPSTEERPQPVQRKSETQILQGFSNQDTSEQSADSLDLLTESSMNDECKTISNDSDVTGTGTCTSLLFDTNKSFESSLDCENSKYYREEDFSSLNNPEIERDNFIEEQDYTSSIFRTSSEEEPNQSDTIEISDQVMTSASSSEDRKTPISVVTKQMQQYCDELRTLLYNSNNINLENNEEALEPIIAEPENSKELKNFQEELNKANEEQNSENVVICKHNASKIKCEPDLLDLDLYPTCLEVSQAAAGHYCEKMKNINSESFVTNNPSLACTNFNHTNNNLIDSEIEDSSLTKITAQAEDIKPVNEDPGEDNLIPGSIAEREHLKWLNAAPIPNNPYSADALQRRLSETERKSKLIDVGNASPEKTEDYNKIENSNTTQERSIQAVLGAGQNDYKRYGRDYYINEAKKASGARKKLSDFSSLSHSTDDEKSLLLSQKPGDLLESEELYTAQPIHVEVEAASWEKEEEASAESDLPSPSPSSTRPDSLTFSEDSDTTRIYDIRTGQSKIVHTNQIIEKSTTPPPTPIEDEEIAINENLLKPTFVNAKLLSPDTIKFFAPKKKPVFGGSHPNLTQLEPNAPPTDHFKVPRSRKSSISDFSIIEKDVIEALPSVKALALQYTTSNQEDLSNLGPIIKPKDFIRQTSDDDAENKIEEIKKIKLQSYNSPTYHPMAPGHSITARSLSKQIREELKSNATDDHKEKTIKQPSPERPPSPVLIPGHLKSSIQFFENLKNK